jgi:hypothetical protein
LKFELLNSYSETQIPETELESLNFSRFEKDFIPYAFVLSDDLIQRLSGTNKNLVICSLTAQVFELTLAHKKLRKIWMNRKFMMRKMISQGLFFALLVKNMWTLIHCYVLVVIHGYTNVVLLYHWMS